MAEINWNLVGKLDPWGSFVEGRKDAALFEAMTGRKRAGELAAQGDLQGAAAEAMRVGDTQTATRLYDVIRGDKRDALETRRHDESIGLQREKFAADQDYRTQSLGVQRDGQNKEPDTIRTMRAMGIDPRSPEARGYVKQPGNTGFSDTADLRKEIRALPSYKAMAEVAPRYDSMTAAAQRDNRASDVSLVFGLMKTLDPTSVVRESEVSMAQNVATLPEQYRAQVQSFLTGKGRLAPEVRQAILAEAKGALDSYVTAYDRDVAQYRNIVGSSGLREDLVIPSFGMPQRAGATPQFNPADLQAEARRRGLIK